MNASSVGLVRGRNPCGRPKDDHFTVTSNNADGRHVLLIDDTWTSGGHALSATLALRASGADQISVLVLARWLTLG